ncbi:ATP-dependent helicase [Ammonifex thiophilus]|nr:ATP-dependent helicase [Ammonifex thiophilus]
MTISVEELCMVLEERNGFPLNDRQREVVAHGSGPLLVVAGPGTGKTETLVARCLKLLCCDRVDPRAIIVTTFTEKAARNLEQRIAGHMTSLQERFPCLSDININRLRIGTLHSLANDILQEYRYLPYRNVRLLDEVEARMFIRRHIAYEVRTNWHEIISHFSYLLGHTAGGFSLWDVVRMLEKLFNWIVEYRVDLHRLQGAPEGAYRQLAEAYSFYRDRLEEQGCCDFAHLQQLFLEFLDSPQGQLFLGGNSQTGDPPIACVLVDEYQDTNPIQEEIYFRLASAEPHNLTVVGDDDQAIYRFRGSTVECMVRFSQRCENRWNVRPHEVRLQENYRSDQRIVEWYGWYIQSFNLMQQQGVRLWKPMMVSRQGIRGSYPALGFLEGRNINDLAQQFATFVRSLRDQGTIEDYSQCVLLLRSTKEASRAAGPFVSALRDEGIPVYNPRSKAYSKQPEVREVLGVLVTILNPDGTDLPDHVRDWIQEASRVIDAYPDLRGYVERSRERIRSAEGGEILAEDFLEVVYRILSFPPFLGYRQDPVRDYRLSKLTRLFESFGSICGRRLERDRSQPSVSGSWLRSFCEVLGGYFETYGVDDDEDEEVVCPRGSFPVMTIHQAKGLEFDFVFVGRLGSACAPRGEHRLEAEMAQFRREPPMFAFRPEELALQDDVRLYYVAYSRAKYALILLVTKDQLRRSASETVSFGGEGGVGMRRRFQKL